VINGAPGIAVSLCVPDLERECDYAPAGRYAMHAARNILRQKLPVGILLNINVPCLPGEKIHGVRITRQGMQAYRDELVTRTDPRGKPYYWIGGDPPAGVPEEDTDFGAISEGFVSVTPVQLDLTAYFAMEGLRAWDWGGG
jgi:5'-nucleotidase